MSTALQPNEHKHSKSRHKHDNQDAARDNSAAPAAQAEDTAPAEKKEYVDQDRAGKASTLVDVMGQSKDILKQNGIDEKNDSVLASLMMNEGGRNGRRSTVGKYFKGEASKLNKSLTKQGIDPEKLAADPKAREALEKKLPEDQRFLLDRVISGEIKLNDLNSPETMQKLTEAGIDKRVEQYKEMEDLKKAQKENGKLDKKDAARLKQLQNMKGGAVGFDKVDAKMGSKFGDLDGLSEDRVREIYAEGQQRFEPHIYRKAKADYDKKIDAYMKGDKSDPLGVKAGGVGTANLSEADVQKMQDAGNHDLLADVSTSYGTSQIMGLYAQNNSLHAKDGTGADVSYDLPTLKQSMNRLTPNSEDVNMQVAFLNMKAGGDPAKVGKSLEDVDSLIQLYNGSKKKSALHQGYRKRMLPNKDAYDQAKQEKADAESTRQLLHQSYAD